MKLQHLLEQYTNDIRAVIKAKGIDLTTADHGKTGLKTMWTATHIARENRAYDDNHPGFVSGRWQRVRPYDGSDYCEFYEGGANDSHVETLLRAIRKTLLEEALSPCDPVTKSSIVKAAFPDAIDIPLAHQK